MITIELRHPSLRHAVDPPPLDARARLTPENQLLAGFAESDRWRLSPHLKRVMVYSGTTLSQRAALVKEAVFPITAVLARSDELANGTASELSNIGYEGFSGIARALAGDTSLDRIDVTISALAYELPADVFRSALEHSPHMQRLFALRASHSAAALSEGIEWY